MMKTTLHKAATSKPAARAQTRHAALKHARGAKRDRPMIELGALFQELRAWDELSAESLRAHGF